MDLTEKTIIIITILGLSLFLYLCLMTTGCQTPYSDYGFGVDDLDKIAGANECITDGFDWICRGPVQYITVQEVIVETVDPVEIVIREIYLISARLRRMQTVMSYHRLLMSTLSTSIQFLW